MFPKKSFHEKPTFDFLFSPLKDFYLISLKYQQMAKDLGILKGTIYRHHQMMPLTNHHTGYTGAWACTKICYCRSADHH